MTIEELTIEGYRGFAKKQSLRLAQPTGEIGSGFTILVGPNNGGKSTVVEALDALFSPSSTVSFSEGKRNAKVQGRVSIQARMTDGSVHELMTAGNGGSETTRGANSSIEKVCYFLPSRRFFNPCFNAGTDSRQSYAMTQNIGQTRSTPISRFSQRLFEINKNRGRFDEVLREVMIDVPDWTIEQSDQGQYFVKIDSAGQAHTSDGLGEGIISLFFMVDALYDASQSDLIVVDEPELSLHPQYQKRLLQLFADRARNMQIVFATHSPLMVDIQHIVNGAEIARIHKSEGDSIVSQVRRATSGRLHPLLKDTHNPHVLGVDAREVFFQEDGVVVVEGQEDAIFYPYVLDQLTGADLVTETDALKVKERIFGWGAGGADKIERIVTLLSDLGFRKVAAIVDKDKEQELTRLGEKNRRYLFNAIPADDVRTKDGCPEKDCNCRTEKKGLLDETGVLRPEFRDETAEMFERINSYLSSTNETGGELATEDGSYESTDVE